MTRPGAYSYPGRNRFGLSNLPLTADLPDLAERRTSWNSVTDLVAGSEIAFADRGRHQLTGVSDPWPVFAVAGT